MTTPYEAGPEPDDHRPAPLRFDRLTFRSMAEIEVYKAFKRAQLALPREHTIAITPNAGTRVNGRTIEPDFVIAFGGRVGVLEVDGHHHQRRYAADRSRDHQLEDAGIAYVDRIFADDTGDPDEVDALVARFLVRLNPDTGQHGRRAA